MMLSLVIFFNIVQDSSISGAITSIGLIEQPCLCPKCYSTDFEWQGKTIKCITCKSRSLYLQDSTQQNQIKLNVTDINHNMFEFIIERSTFQASLQQSNHEQLCQNDLLEDEDVLLALSSMNVLINFNPKTIHIHTIALNNI
ncbi:unnamed protein product [Rotaria sp. Silwood1]|nr:unnamed protein product [Rotaria sp. Silwood1]